jgi:hypothetical protein|tara:strand:- start:442 stop:603 length:162 start_codon:yes stop_codon:yes gene_type:complete
MTNDDSYNIMLSLRKYLKIHAYETDKLLEIIIQFKTEDNRIHQLCNCILEKKK